MVKCYLLAHHMQEILRIKQKISNETLSIRTIVIINLFFVFICKCGQWSEAFIWNFRAWFFELLQVPNNWPANSADWKKPSEWQLICHNLGSDGLKFIFHTLPLLHCKSSVYRLLHLHVRIVSLKILRFSAMSILAVPNRWQNKEVCSHQKFIWRQKIGAVNVFITIAIVSHGGDCYSI